MIADKPIEVPVRWRAAAPITLLEVMLAIDIMATILVVLFGTCSAAVDRAVRARDLSQVYQEARVLLQLMGNDLRSAYVMEPAQQAQQALQQASQQGKTEPITFLGEDRTQANNPADKLAFSTVLPTQSSDVPAPEMCHVTYNIEPVNEPSQGRALFRRVNCSLDPEDSDQDRLFLLTELAYGLDFKYYDDQGTEYLDWNSRQPRGGKRMPARVKITLLLADQRGQLGPFEIITDLVLSR
jgi:type II secretory pathway pseudopilin PulG